MMLCIYAVCVVRKYDVWSAVLVNVVWVMSQLSDDDMLLSEYSAKYFGINLVLLRRLRRCAVYATTGRNFAPPMNPSSEWVDRFVHHGRCGGINQPQFPQPPQTTTVQLRFRPLAETPLSLSTARINASWWCGPQLFSSKPDVGLNFAGKMR